MSGPVSARAPYPTLVTVGHDEEEGHVFLDLEHLGALAVSGDEQGSREVLVALVGFDFSAPSPLETVSNASSPGVSGT